MTECGLSTERQFELRPNGDAGVEYLKPAASDLLLQRWSVSKRVNSSKAPGDDDPTLIERIDLGPGLLANGEAC